MVRITPVELGGDLGLCQDVLGQAHAHGLQLAHLRAQRGVGSKQVNAAVTLSRAVGVFHVLTVAGKRPVHATQARRARTSRSRTTRLSLKCALTRRLCASKLMSLLVFQPATP